MISIPINNNTIDTDSRRDFNDTMFNYDVSGFINIVLIYCMHVYRNNDVDTKRTRLHKIIFCNIIEPAYTTGLFVIFDR